MFGEIVERLEAIGNRMSLPLRLRVVKREDLFNQGDLT